MKKLIASLIAMVTIFTSFSFITVPAFADDDHCVDTAILGEGGKSCDNGQGSSIWSVLKLVVDILTVGIGILGVIGITVVGIQYLTAGGSEEKTRKAKRRMFEIIIGLVAYVVLYATLSWLLPGFNGVKP